MKLPIVVIPICVICLSPGLGSGQGDGDARVSSEAEAIADSNPGEADAHANGEDAASDARQGEVTYAPGDGELLRALGEGYLSNREAFPFLRCRFTVYEGTVSCVEHALEGKLDDVVELKGVWVVDGNKSRFELHCDPQLIADAIRRPERIKMPGNPDAFAVELPADTYGFLTENEIDFRFDDAIHSANVSRRAVLPLPGITTTPFTLGVMEDDESLSPGRVLTEGRAGEPKYAWIEGTEQTDNGELVIACTGWGPQESGKVSHRMYINPVRGCLAEQYFMYSRAPKAEEKLAPRAWALYFTDVRECSRGRSFPMRGVLVWEPDSGDSGLSAKIVEVVELDVDNRPNESDFVMRLPAGTAISDPTDMRSAFRIREDRHIAPADLTALLDTTRRVVQNQMHEEPIEQATSHRYLILLLGNGAVAVAVLAFFAWRRYRALRGP